MKNICAHSRTSERSCGCAGALVCRVLRVRKSLMCWVRMLPPLLADAFHASLHLGCDVKYIL